MAKKVVAGVIASMLVIIVCAGAIIGLVNSTGKAPSIHTTSKASRSISKSNPLCATAIHKESCELMLQQLSPKLASSGGDSRFESSLAQGPSAHTKIFRGFVETTQKELEIAVKLSAGVANGKVVARTAAAKEDCNKLLTDALLYVKQAVALVGDKDIEGLTAEAERIMGKLTSAMTYMYTCVDGFTNPKLNAEMDHILKNATLTSSNALAVINSFSPSKAQHKPSQGTSSRKLLGYAMDKQGYPRWLSAGDRKLLQTASSSTPNVTVAQDGSGDYKTISDAIKNIPSNYTGRYVIYVKAGVYAEVVNIPREKENVTMYGDGMDKSIITGSMSDKDSGTKLASVFEVHAEYFIAKDMGFRNTAGANGFPAVAVTTAADFITFFQCKIDGFQDTLYTVNGVQFFRDCTISGTIDFIFGNAAVVFQNCKIVLNTPQSGALNVITANGRTDANMKTGIVFQKCQIIADADFEKSCSATGNYLGRPWKEYSRTVIIESSISACIHPEGWLAWMNTTAGLSTLTYAEYGNTGGGAATDKRVKWPGYSVLSQADLAYYSVDSFLNGTRWLAATSVPRT